MKRILLALIGVLSSVPSVMFAAEDTRQLVKMPPEARAELRTEMLDFQAALNSIIASLADGKFSEAADTAESQVGISAMGRHRRAPMNARPGMYMPDEMHAVARGMHAAGSEFARVAKAGDMTRALQALTGVTGACVACHRSYRIQ